jgi:hypothetical protein
MIISMDIFHILRTFMVIDTPNYDAPGETRSSTVNYTGDSI